MEGYHSFLKMEKDLIISGTVNHSIGKPMLFYYQGNTDFRETKKTLMVRMFLNFHLDSMYFFCAVIRISRDNKNIAIVNLFSQEYNRL